jgi:hypothetical protein
MMRRPMTAGAAGKTGIQRRSGLPSPAPIRIICRLRTGAAGLRQILAW